MTAVNVLAAIFAVIVLVKIAALLVNPKKVLKLGEGAIHHFALAKFTYLVLIVITGYYLLQELMVTQIAAVMLFTSLLFGMTLLGYDEHFLRFYKAIAKDRNQIISRAWIPVLIWVVLAAWVLAVLIR